MDPEILGWKAQNTGSINIAKCWFDNSWIYLNRNILQETTFDECLKLIVRNFLGLQVNLQCHEQCEEELVIFIQPSHSVLVYFIGEMLNYVGYSFGCDLRFQ